MSGDHDDDTNTLQHSNSTADTDADANAGGRATTDSTDAAALPADQLGIGGDAGGEQREQRIADAEQGPIPILERITDGFFALDSEWRFTYVNAHANDLINPEGEDLIGENVWERFPEAVGGTIEAKYRWAMEHQEPVDFDVYFDPLEAWFDIQAYPSETGVSVFFNDISGEKQRERELKKYETLTETAADAIITIDSKSIIRDANPAVADLFGYESGELIGKPLTILMPADLREQHRDGIARYLRTGEKNIEWEMIELPGVTADGTEIVLEISFNEYTHAGERYFTGIIRDVTEDKKQQRQMEEMHNRIADAFLSLDPNGRVEHMNEQAEDLLMLPEEALVGTVLWEPFPDVFEETFREDFEQAMAEQEPRTLERYYPFLDKWYRGRIYPSETGASVYYRDVTEEKRNEQQLAENTAALRELYEASTTSKPFEDKLHDVLEIGCERLDVENGFLARIDEDRQAFETMQVVGNALEIGVRCPLDRTYCQTVFESDGVLATTTAGTDDEWVRECAYDTFGFDTYIGTVVRVDGAGYGTIGFVDEGSRTREFSEHEKALVDLIGQWISYELEHQHREYYLRQCYEITSDPDSTFEEKVQQLFELGCERFGMDLGALARADHDADEFTPELVSEPHPHLAPGNTFPLSSTYCRVPFEVEHDGSTGEPVVVPNPDQCGGFRNDVCYKKFGMESYIGVRLVIEDDADRTFFFLSETPRDELSDAERMFHRLMGQWISYELERKNAREEIKTNHERLESINNLNRITRGIAHSIVDGDSRQAIEQAVCDRLTAPDTPYTLAWIGDVRYRDDEILPSYAAGNRSGYLDNISVPIGGDPEREDGPAATAVKQHTPQVVNDMANDDRVEPWREQALAHGYQSGIAIPIVHNALLFGVLCVYAPQTGAFGREERDILTHLGELVGHSIQLLDQERALSAETVTEVKYRNNEVGQEIAAATRGESDADPRIEVERVIQTSDGFATFVCVNGMSPAAFAGVFRELPTVTNIDLMRPSDGSIDSTEPCDGWLFRADLTNDSLGARIRRHGGQLKHLVVDSDGLTLTADLPPQADIGDVTDAVQDAYPGTELVSKREADREWLSADEIKQVFDSEVTAKQRTALEAAHIAGFFEYPRESTATDVADVLGVTQPTFTEHLRAAERKVFDMIFDAEGHNVEGI